MCGFPWKTIRHNDERYPERKRNENLIAEMIFQEKGKRMQKSDFQTTKIIFCVDWMEVLAQTCLLEKEEGRRCQKMIFGFQMIFASGKETRGCQRMIFRLLK